MTIVTMQGLLRNYMGTFYPFLLCLCKVHLKESSCIEKYTFELELWKSNMHYFHFAEKLLLQKYSVYTFHLYTV